MQLAIVHTTLYLLALSFSFLAGAAFLTAPAILAGAAFISAAAAPLLLAACCCLPGPLLASGIRGLRHMRALASPSVSCLGRAMALLNSPLRLRHGSAAVTASGRLVGHLACRRGCAACVWLSSGLGGWGAAGTRAAAGRCAARSGAVPAAGNGLGGCGAAGTRAAAGRYASEAKLITVSCNTSHQLLCSPVQSVADLGWLGPGPGREHAHQLLDLRGEGGGAVSGTAGAGQLEPGSFPLTGYPPTGVRTPVDPTQQGQQQDQLLYQSQHQQRYQQGQHLRSARAGLPEVQRSLQQQSYPAALRQADIQPRQLQHGAAGGDPARQHGAGERHELAYQPPQQLQPQPQPPPPPQQQQQPHEPGTGTGPSPALELGR